MSIDWKLRFVHKLFPYNVATIDIDGAFMIKEPHVPKMLYKYRRFTDLHMQSLEQATLWMSAPSAFNDVYDGAVTFNPERFLVEDLTVAEQLQRVEDLKAAEKAGHRYVEPKIRNPIQSGVLMRRHMEELLASEPPERREIFREFLTMQNRHQRDEMVKSTTKFFRSGFSVLSLTPLLDEDLMWGHYSENHTGFCIEYNFEALERGNILRRLCFPVFYSSKIRDATRYMQRTDEQRFNNLFGQYLCLVKNTKWQYEKEWRIMMAIGPEHAARPLDMPRPSAIYLGNRVAPDNQERMREFCDRMSIPMFKMNMDPHAYRLTPELIKSSS